MLNNKHTITYSFQPQNPSLQSSTNLQINQAIKSHSSHTSREHSDSRGSRHAPTHRNTEEASFRLHINLNMYYPPRRGLAAFTVERISKLPSVFFTSQDQPEPKCATVTFVKASTKASTEPHCFSMALFSSPFSSVLLGVMHYIRSGRQTIHSSKTCGSTPAPHC